MNEMSWTLGVLTFALVIVGAILYDAGSVGWAQLMFVTASGTAGAGVMAVVDKRHYDEVYWRDRSFWDE